jgi:hypothetical protein
MEEQNMFLVIEEMLAVTKEAWGLVTANSD